MVAMCESDHSFPPCPTKGCLGRLISAGDGRPECSAGCHQSATDFKIKDTKNPNRNVAVELRALRRKDGQWEL